MCERSLQERERESARGTAAASVCSVINIGMGKGRERERESDAIEQGCYIRDVGGVSAHNVEGSGPCRRRVGCGEEGLVWMQCKVSSFSL